MTSKVAYLWQFGFFFLCPDCPKQPRIDNSFYRFLYPMICGTIHGDESLGKPLTLAVILYSMYNFKSWIVNWQFFTINSYQIQTNRNSGWIRLNWNDDCPWNHFLDCHLWLTCSIARSLFSKINYLGCC